jgi:hypothetical protein
LPNISLEFTAIVNCELNTTSDIAVFVTESGSDKAKRPNQLAKEHTPDVPKEVSVLQLEIRKAKLKNML